MREKGPQKDLEFIAVRESFNPTTLYNDNNSELANKNRDSFWEAKLKGKVFIVQICSDSRSEAPKGRCIYVPSVATAGSRRAYNEMMNYKGVGAIINIVHVDGETVEPAKMPKGCGGLGVKEASLEDPSILEGNTMLDGYVETRIPSKDPLIQDYFYSEMMANYSNKPVLAAVQDHRTKLIVPVFYFEPGGRKIISPVPLRYMTEKNYNQEKIYREGLPTLELNEIPDEMVQEFLYLSEKHAGDLRLKNPDLYEKTKKQNPGVVVMSTEKLRAGERYPNLLEEPGSYFSIHLAREGDWKVVDRIATKLGVAQAKYPLEHFDVHTVLVETPGLNQSKGIARELEETIIEEKWKLKSNFQIIATESNAARTTSAEIYKKAS